MSDTSLISELDKLLTPIADKEHMQAWIHYWIGITIPDCRVTEFADSTPLDFIYEVYRAIMDGKSLNIIALAGRGSGKTLAVSIIDLLSLLHDQRSAIHIGVTEEQASRARDYFDGYLAKIALLKTFRGDEDNKQRVTFNFTNKLTNEIHSAAMEIISLHPKRVQGPHYALVSYDELSSATEKNSIKAYRDSAGIPVRSSKGKPSVKVKITSRQTQSSIAETEVMNAEKLRLTVLKWTTLDVMEKCEPERSGTISHPLYINTLKGEHLKPAEFEKMPSELTDGFTLAMDVMDKCLQCPLLHYCKGRARFQTSISPILSKIDDVIDKVISNGHDWVLSQLMSIKPSSVALVYHEFDPALHIPGWNIMWERLTGEKSEKLITRDQFMSKCKELKLTFMSGVDWGFTHPATCIVLATDTRDNIYVLGAYGATGKDDPEWVQFIMDVVMPAYPIEGFCPDTENPSGISLLKKALIQNNYNTVVFEIDKGKGSVKRGVNTVKRFLKVPGKNRYTKIFFAPDLPEPVNFPGIIKEFGLYEKEIDPATGNPVDGTFRKGEEDHLDGLRYPMDFMFSKDIAQMHILGEGGGSGDPEEDKRLATLKEAQRVGNFNVIDNRDDVDPNKKGDDPNDKGPKGSGGGLSWAWT